MLTAIIWKCKLQRKNSRDYLETNVYCVFVYFCITPKVPFYLQLFFTNGSILNLQT